jgi:serine phosphatase RsbU (regulator of sigma subunit)
MEVQPNLPLGLFGSFPYEGQECDIVKGTSIFLYTDGVTEAEDKAKVLYSDERLLDLLGKQGKNTPQMIAENVLDDINKHVNGAEQSDDITIMCVHYR